MVIKKKPTPPPPELPKYPSQFPGAAQTVIRRRQEWLKLADQVDAALRAAEKAFETSFDRADAASSVQDRISRSAQERARKSRRNA